MHLCSCPDAMRCDDGMGWDGDEDGDGDGDGDGIIWDHMGCHDMMDMIGHDRMDR